MPVTKDSDTASVASPAIILVEPQLGENIGMVARAMANFGLVELRLVNPRDGWPNEKARAAASRADHVIDAVKVFDDLATAMADLNFVFATTARQRDGFKPVRGPVEAGRVLRARHGMGQRTGILFGRERFGLYNDEVGLADEIVTFPVDPDFSSLNIAQAALLMSYEWMKSGLEDETKTNFTGPDMKPASKEELHGLFAYLEGALEARGYFRPAPKKPKMVDNLRAVLTRAGFAEPELKVLRGIISSLDRFSPAMPRGDGSPGDDPRRLPAAARAGGPGRKTNADRQVADDDDNPAPPLGGKGTDND
ncbi:MULTISPECIES: RNA methyltransferase [unclassified Mesorhizobium]|uniref:RNA methyltransferase n=1 Tax=unclassified Mesorhizobium TaxID=325217 RepID=UPI00112D94C6|nr:MULTISPECIES: RNA methyltransferase [unclassified Mesorhizobium]MCA0022989.1 RNA methyltransferase [Mesorhizobium sp. B263B1A]TPJ98792.1 RNA methyltransferase [Mesorhizobium sp. B2-5-12]TPK28956.1 RNA methyltransferase [Mesorhizobium sp. B2-5-6]TPL57063.1 RNA methyltransferase [Mesorhizobium sp. B2-4-2]TPM08363.1 RNA methyltransferase [Mesorhizobium sp. B2-3-8]